MGIRKSILRTLRRQVDVTLDPIEKIVEKIDEENNFQNEQDLAPSPVQNAVFWASEYTGDGGASKDILPVGWVWKSAWKIQVWSREVGDSAYYEKQQTTPGKDARMSAVGYVNDDLLECIAGGIRVFGNGVAELNQAIDYDYFFMTWDQA